MSEANILQEEPQFNVFIKIIENKNIIREY